MKAFVLPAIFMICLAGCATHPGGARLPRNSVPSARRFEPALLRPSQKRSSAITIVRESGVRGGGVDFYLDGERAARIAAGEVITFYLRPGRHLLGLRPLFSPKVEQLLTLQRGDEIAVRIIDRKGNYELRIAEPGWFQSIGRTFHARVWDPLARRVTASSRPSP